MMENSKAFLFRYLVATVVLVFVVTSLAITPILADDASDARQLVEKSEMTFKNMLAAKELQPFQGLLGKAKGVLISPQVLEGAFIFGVSGGSGVFLVHDGKTDAWKGPAFYTIGEVSFGFQAGGKASQVIMLAMTDRGVNALLSPSVKLGADVGVAAGPVGVGAAAATANISADILVYAMSEGLYGGISLTGAVVAVRNGWNEAYYSRPGITPTDILILGNARNPSAAGLVEAVSRAASARKMGEIKSGGDMKMEPTTQTGQKVYRVKAGDTLYDIAREHGTTVRRLVELNHLQEKQYIYPGQELRLP